MMNTYYPLLGGQDLTQPAIVRQSVDVGKELALLESELTRVTQVIKGGLLPAQYEQANALQFGLNAVILIAKKNSLNQKKNRI